MSESRWARAPSRAMLEPDATSGRVGTPSTHAPIVSASGSHTRPVVLVIHQGAELYGSDRVLLYIVQGLRAAGRFHPVVVLPEDGPLRRELDKQGIEVHFAEVLKVDRGMFRAGRLISLPGRARRAFRKFDEIVAGRSVALVHSNTLAVLAGALWARRRGLRHVWHVHEILLKPVWVARAFPRIVHALSSRVIAVSEDTRCWLASIEPRIATKTSVVFNGLPEASPTDPVDGSAFRRQIGASNDDVVVTLAGRLNRWKGQDILIAAAELLQAQGRLARLRFAIVGRTFAGQEHIREALVAQVAAADLQARVSFVDFVDDIRYVWQGTDIAVVPSTDPEPFGMVAIEAMAARLPVVAANHGGLTEIVRHRETGLLVEPRNVSALADALAELGSSAASRAAWGQAGYVRQVDRFSIAAQIRNIEAVYLESLSS